MRRIVVTGIVLVGVVILSSLAATRAPETSVVVAAPSQNPQPVTVTNFPSVQGVSGTVNVGNLPAFQNVTVGNLPAVQQVGGSVAVTNLPGIQSVTGNVAVSNLPAVQMVGGSVAVSNLPLDADGNVRVSSPTAPPSPQIHFIGFTKPIEISDVFGMSIECNAEFPGTRACKTDEFLYAIPPPTDWPGDRAGVLPPVDAPFRCVNKSYQSGCATGGLSPAACCGY